MAEWIVCPNCNLHHSVRATRICPRCKLSIDGAEAPPAAGSMPPPAFAGPTSAPPQPASTTWQTGVASGGCTNHPAVTTELVSCRRCGRRFCPDCVVALRGAFFCIDCKDEQMRDLQSGLSPGMLELASIGRRFGALWLDGLLETFAMYAVLIPLGLLFNGVVVGEPSQATTGPQVAFLFLTYAFAFGVPLVYEALMLSSRGQTLGKMALGLKVVTPDGGDISVGQAWGRAAAKVALASCLAATYWPALFTQEKTTLHDMLAGTRVVRIQ